MTINAAPKAFISRALDRNISSPSLSEIELTMHLPWAFFSPVTIVSQWDESIIIAALATSGSPAMWRRKVSISLAESSMASSMLMSMTSAPFSICPAAIRKASS